MELKNLFFRRNRNKDKDVATIAHYAPDMNLTPQDYIFPLSADARLKEDERRIKDFLQATHPDSLCEAFYDRYADSEDAQIAAIMACQRAGHLAAATEIVEKHNAELSRLDCEIAATDMHITTVEEELEQLKELISKFN